MKEFYPFFVDYIPLIISNVIVIAFFLFFQKNTKKVKTSYKSKIAELESRSLRAQMNPHFIFNAINGVQSIMLLMAQALERSLNIYLSILPDAEEEYMEISNLVKEPDFPYGQEYISLLARQGKIDAHKEGENWHTSKAAVTNYILNRKRKRHLQ
ncbi:histidine kinase [Flavobacteriaceae bacterium]|nr:histidine kinase [Flavobacteriaceae bacterium]